MANNLSVVTPITNIAIDTLVVILHTPVQHTPLDYKKEGHKNKATITNYYVVVASTTAFNTPTPALPKVTGGLLNKIIIITRINIILALASTSITINKSHAYSILKELPTISYKIINIDSIENILLSIPTIVEADCYHYFSTTN